MAPYQRRYIALLSRKRKKSERQYIGWTISNATQTQSYKNGDNAPKLVQFKTLVVRTLQIMVEQ